MPWQKQRKKQLLRKPPKKRKRVQKRPPLRKRNSPLDWPLVRNGEATICFHDSKQQSLPFSCSKTPQFLINSHNLQCPKICDQPHTNYFGMVWVALVRLGLESSLFKSISNRALCCDRIPRPEKIPAVNIKGRRAVRRFQESHRKGRRKHAL